MSSLTAAVRAFTELSPAQRRLGPYRCSSLLGKGGFAPVFRAEEVHGGITLREVAVKVFGVGGAAHADYRARVIEEARALCRVQHPNVVRFITLHEDETRGLLGLVMEHVEGLALDRHLGELARDDASRVTLAVDAGHAVASALAVTHQMGLVHRDVKPANILVSTNDYKLIDFGIAASGGRAPHPVDAPTILGDVPIAASLDSAPSSGEPASSTADVHAGTPGYVDPVCGRDQVPATHSSDLYALGATIFECLTGLLPAAATSRARGETGLDEFVMLGKAAPVPIADIRAGVPVALARLVDSLLSPDRARRPRSAEVVARELERIRGELLGRKSASPDETRGPFRGLARFEREDRDLYFGRTAEAAGLIELLRVRGLVAIVGASGSGKSSLARAGVLPRVEEGALGRFPPRWRSFVITPGVDALGALRSAIGSAIGQEPARTPEGLAQQVAAHVEAQGEGLLIVLDQLEEIVTQQAEGAPGRAVVLDFLANIADNPVPGVRSIVTARRDLLDEVLAIEPHFARAIARGMQFLAPLSASTWSEVVEQALDAYGYAFEDDALRVEVLSELAGRHEAMPLVQFALAELWTRRDPECRWLTRAGYRAVGGVSGALERHADATLAELGEDLDPVRTVLLAMTTPAGTRAHVAVESLRTRADARIDDIVARLQSARLVIREPAGLTLAHESLLTEWTRLREWIAEAREDRVLAEEIVLEAARWRRSRDDATLWRGRRLAAAVALSERAPTALGNEGTAFVSRSRAAARGARGAVALALVGLLGTGAYEATRYVRELERARTAAVASEHAASAAKADADRTLAEFYEEAGRQQLVGGHHEAALPYLSAAYSLGLRGEPLRLMLTIALRGAEEGGLWLRGHTGPVRSLVRSTGGARVLTASDDGTARIWDANRGTELRVLHHGAPLRSATFSDDDRTVRALGADGSSSTWNAMTGARTATQPTKDRELKQDNDGAIPQDRVRADGLVRLERHALVSSGLVRAYPRLVSSEADAPRFSPCGRWLALGSRIARASTGAIVAELPVAADRGETWFSSDGERAYRKSGDVLIEWSTRDFGELRRIPTAESFAVSDDGTILTTSDEEVLAFPPGTTQPSRRARFGRGLRGVAAAPGGEVFAAIVDRAVVVYDARRGHERHRAIGLGSSIDNLAFSGDGRSLIWLGLERGGGVAEVMDLASGATVVLRGQSSALASAVISRDGSRVVTVGHDGSVRLWAIGDGRASLIMSLPRKEESLYAVAVQFGSGSRVLAVGFRDEVSFRDATDGRLLGSMSMGKSRYVEELAVDPSGSWLATTFATGFPRLWDIHGEARSSEAVAADVARLSGYRLEDRRLVEGGLSGAATAQP